MLIPRSSFIPDDRLCLLMLLINEHANVWFFSDFFSDPALDFYFITEKFPPFLFIDFFFT